MIGCQMFNARSFKRIRDECADVADVYLIESGCIIKITDFNELFRISSFYSEKLLFLASFQVGQLFKIQAIFKTLEKLPILS